MVSNANTIFRDFETDGVPASGPHSPRKVEIREWGGWIEQLHAGIQAGGGLVFQIKAAMTLGHAANQMAWVIADPVTANNGIYQKLGGSGAGSWVRIGDLPYSFIRASNTGAGTPNAIKATSVMPIPTADGAALITVNVTDHNTGPATIAFNGDPPLAIKTSSAHDVAAGGLQPGMILAGYVSGSTLRLLTDQASAAIQAAAEAAQAAAASSATNAAASEALAKKWATEAENTEVAPGLFSAFHWAQKAASYVLGGIAAAIHGAPAKATPVDTDEFGYANSASGFGLVKMTWTNVKAALKAYFDSIYATAAQGALASAALPKTGGVLTGAAGGDPGAGKLNASELQQNGTAIANAKYVSKAWVVFNGIGTVAVLDSLNVSSVTRNTTGLYVVNFTTPRPSADYAIGWSVGVTNGIVAARVTSKNTTDFAISTMNSAFTGADCAYVSACVFGA
ncbi:hypothetical protein M2281_000174 [Mesorhizobium soli]|uniref:hypothetical protein n=1 Tax=Pseudaminobacter soli (ex Li et al. 2025) TaxID=1295366 RepID=UPI0024740F46|nr:hypothetical protein [Mesorhizobium soli]MDH6229602.1 hypothetical protein [Mesorhizobium soli]